MRAKRGWEASPDDMDALRDLRIAQRAVLRAEEERVKAVDECRKKGIPWEAIGAATGTTKSAVHRRYRTEENR